jgi:hypothetical protein
MSSFTVGQRVRCTDASDRDHLTEGNEYTIVESFGLAGDEMVRVEGDSAQYYASRFEAIGSTTYDDLPVGTRVRAVLDAFDLRRGDERVISRQTPPHVKVEGSEYWYTPATFEVIGRQATVGGFHVGDRVKVKAGAGQYDVGTSIDRDAVHVVRAPQGHENTRSLRFEGNEGGWHPSSFELAEEDGELAAKAAKWDEMKAGLVHQIRAAAKANSYSFCDEGLKAFCEEVGIDFIPTPTGVRGVLFVDVAALPRDEQVDVMNKIHRLVESELGPKVERAVAFIDPEGTDNNTYWPTRPTATPSHYLSGMEHVYE